MTDQSEIERLVKLETRMDRMESDVHAININVAELKALANQGKGSLRTFLWLGGLVSGFIALLSINWSNFKNLF